MNLRPSGHEPDESGLHPCALVGVGAAQTQVTAPLLPGVGPFVCSRRCRWECEALTSALTRGPGGCGASAGIARAHNGRRGRLTVKPNSGDEAATKQTIFDRGLRVMAIRLRRCELAVGGDPSDLGRP